MQVVDDGAQMAEIEQQVEREQNSANLAVFSDLRRILALLYSSSSLTSANVAGQEFHLFCCQWKASQSTPGGLAQSFIGQCMKYRGGPGGPFTPTAGTQTAHFL